MKNLKTIKNLAAQQILQEAKAISLWIKLGGGFLLLFITIHFSTGMGEAIASTKKTTTTQNQEIEEIWNQTLHIKNP